VLATQLTIELAVGRRSFGIKPARTLWSLLVHAEDDEGDIIEMSRMVIHLGLTDVEKGMVAVNTLIDKVLTILSEFWDNVP
jgi:hypothetical protein